MDPDTGRTLGPGEVGEFCSRGYNTMQGYYKMEEATRQVIDKDGWLHSGDLATVDENGYYKITGRIKDMIIRGGENIYPKEIEEFLYTVPEVQDVQVIGVPSKKYGEEVMACVVLKEGCSLTEEELKDREEGRLECGVAYAGTEITIEDETIRLRHEERQCVAKMVCGEIVVM